MALELCYEAAKARHIRDRPYVLERTLAPAWPKPLQTTNAVSGVYALWDKYPGTLRRDMIQ
jgi:hypothetical protein